MTISPTEVRVGKYLITPLIKTDGTGSFLASVSIRRGVHDRIFRFANRFASNAGAASFATQQGTQLVLANQLG
jgi:hypothetical protein